VASSRFDEVTTTWTRKSAENESMGFDLLGQRPTSLEGKVWMANWACWGELLDLLRALCPSEMAACPYWDANDGQGLDADGAARLARKIT
jgi:hypothetical protein